MSPIDRLSTLFIQLLCWFDVSASTLLVGGVSKWLMCELTCYQPENGQEGQEAEHVGGGQSAGDRAVRHTVEHI